MLTINREQAVLTGWHEVCSDGYAANDRALEARAVAALEEHPHFHGRSEFVHCRCVDSVLRLEGCVPCYYLKQLAQEAVKGIPGLKRVYNVIVVASPAGEVEGCEANEDCPCADAPSRPKGPSRRRRKASQPR